MYPSNANPSLPPAHRRRKSSLNAVLESWPLYLALMPTMSLILVFAYWPTLNGLIQSLYNSTATDTQVFVGLNNYRDLAQDTVFWKSFGNAVWYFVFGITVGWVMPFIAAELLISLSNSRLQYAFRTLLILPMAFPAAVFGFIWSFMYDPNDGVINTLLRNVGLEGLVQNWLGNPSTALGSLMVIGLPVTLLSAGAGLPFLLFLVGLQNIPQEIYDAAAIDGCSRWRRVFAIDLPLLGSQFSLLLMLALIGFTQAGSITLLLATNGGPAFATTTPLTWLIQSGISAGNFGYGSAMGAVLFAVAVTLSAAYLLFLRYTNRSADAARNGAKP